MRPEFFLVVLAAVAASFACATTPAVDPAPPPASSPEAERRIAELEEENASLSRQVETLNELLKKALEVGGINARFCPIAMPPIDAVVLDVKPDLELVVLDKGKKDGVKVGFVFDLYMGATYRGQVRITEVQEGMSVGKILSQKSSIARGDSATTSL